MTAPAVSVLVKAYNHAPYIARAIESILDQSFQDFEIIITDDASTDATLEVARRYRDPRIKLDGFSRNQGISGAMNATIARASGRYFAILNSDDWALPGRLQQQVSAMEANPAVSVVFGLPSIVNEAGAPARGFNDFSQPLRFEDFSRRSWLRQFFFLGNCVCAPTAMVRREAYEAVGLYDRRLTNLQDLDMWIRMLIAGRDMLVLPVHLTAFRIRDDMANMSAPRPDTQLRTMFEMTRILRRFADFDPALCDEVFGGDPDVEPRRRIAELAARDPRAIYQSFALDLLYESARDTDDFDRLRLLSGQIDAYGIARTHELVRTIQRLAGE